MVSGSVDVPPIVKIDMNMFKYNSLFTQDLHYIENM
jgi:hypothetical protein